MSNPFMDYLKASLVDMKGDIKLAFASLPKDAPATDSEIAMLANTLTDPDTFQINMQDMEQLIRSIEILKESGVHPARVPIDEARALTESLEMATINTTTALSAGLTLLHSPSHVSVQSTSLFLPRWKNPNSEPETYYYPLIARSSSSAGAIGALARQIYGGPLDRRKACFDICKKLDTCLLHVWCLVFDHWIGAKTLEPSESSDELASSTTKEEIKDVKPRNEEVLKTEFNDIFILPRAPKRRFTGVMIPGHKRKRDPSNDSSDPKETRSLSKKVKQEVKKEEPEDVERILERNRRLCQLYPRLAQLHQFPSSWPKSIEGRLRAIPLPDPRFVPDDSDMHRKFVRLEFSKTYGGLSVSFEDAWNRKKAADVDMRGLGHPRMIYATLEYNFFLPLVPCAPGLIMRGPGFTDRLDVDPNDLMRQTNPEPRTVFVRIQPNAWLYVGEYRIRLAAALNEWGELTEKERNHWKNYIDRKPVIMERNKMRSKEEMYDALDKGTKMLEVFTMECVDYHQGIQDAICRLPSTV